MIRAAATALFSLLPCLLAATPAEASHCDTVLLEGPSSRAAAECLYRAATRPGGEAEGIRLERWAEQYPDHPWVLFYLGNLQWGSPAIAVDLYQAAAEKFEALSEAEGEVLARGNRSQLLFQIGRIEDSGTEAERAYLRGSESENPKAQAHGSVVLAGYLFQTGQNLERARILLVTARQSSELRESPHLLKTCLSLLGNVALALGDYSKGERAFEELSVLAQELSDPQLGAAASYGLARVFVERLTEEPTEGRREQAIQATVHALDAAINAGVARLEVRTRWVLGILLPWAEAREHLESCKEAASDPREKSYCLNALARRLTQLDPQRARAVLHEAVRQAEAGGDPWSLAFTHREQLRLGWASSSVQTAISESWAALDSIEAIRDLQPEGSEVQARLFSSWVDDYHLFTGRLLKEAPQGSRVDLVAEAFKVSERLRSRALTDWLRSTGQAPAASGTAAFAALSEVQRALGPREALLAYQVAPWEDVAGDFGGGSWVIVVTEGSARAYPLPGRSEIRQAVDQYTGLFEGRDGTEAGPSVTFYQQLLAPVFGDLPAGVDRLILVPDDALHRLPFGALRPAPDAPPLAATHRLTVAPSATLWLGWRRASAAGEVLRVAAEGAGRAPALVLAAPVAPDDLRGSAAAAAADRSPDLALSDLPPLPHARREGRAVKAALGRGTELAMGARASEALLARPDLGSFGVLHLATHAVTDEEHPERSAVVLAPPGDGDPAGPDGLLRAAEIASLDLGGKLVVLSSCRSAAGTVLRGEGVMSLGRAFFQAGARTVVASLWPVRDDEAALLFEAFYRHLARGETVAASLQAAQADRRAAGAPASAWAAFVVLGDGDLAPVVPPPPPDPRVRLARIAAGILAALLLALAAIALRRRLAAALAARRPHDHDLSDLAHSSPSPR